jgi:hypothetical protein
MCCLCLQGRKGIAPPLLTSELEVSGQLHAPTALPPGERAPGTHWIGGWVGPKAGIDAVKKRKILDCTQSNPGRPARRYTNSPYSPYRYIPSGAGTRTLSRRQPVLLTLPIIQPTVVPQILTGHCIFSVLTIQTKTKILKKLNSVALVRERTIPTERPPLVGEVSANVCR